MYTLKEFCFEKISNNPDKFFQNGTGILNLPTQLIEEILSYIDREENGINSKYVNFCLKNDIIIEKINIHGFHLRNEQDLLFLNNPYLKSCEINNIDFFMFHGILSKISNNELKVLKLKESEYLRRDNPVYENFVHSINWNKFHNLSILKLEYDSPENNILINLCTFLIDLEELDITCSETNFFQLKNLLKLRRLRIVNNKKLVVPQTINSIERLRFLQHIELRFSLAPSFPQYDSGHIFRSISWPNLKYYVHYRNAPLQLGLLR